MQIVYISKRPEILLETLHHVVLFMPFVDKAIACVPDAIAEQFQTNASALSLQVIPESSILSDAEINSLPQLDHQRKNYLLRTRLAKHEDVATEFIMSDDDARPIKLVEKSRFIENGRHHSYFFYDLRSWNNNQTEFDAGQLSTCAVLEYLGFPLLSYASHMPQVIDRKLFLEAADFFQKHSLDFSLCEWSTYFNYACLKHPNRFHETAPYMTLCWPEHPLAWKKFVQPHEYLFENYTRANYANGKVFYTSEFDNNDIEITTKNNIRRIIQWRMLELYLRYPEQRKGWKKYFNLRTWANKLLHTN